MYRSIIKAAKSPMLMHWTGKCMMAGTSEDMQRQMAPERVANTLFVGRYFMNRYGSCLSAIVVH